jgi:galactose mutarotase-like enzyme
MPLTHATRVEGYDAIRLRSASAHLDATFVPTAGMVGASLRDAGDELLGRGLGVHCYARGGTTMGIPLVHPWANRLAADEYRVNGTVVRLRPDSPLVARDEHGLPIHGLLGGSPHWVLRHANGNGNGNPHGRSRPRSTSASTPSSSRRSDSPTASRSTSRCAGAP